MSSSPKAKQVRFDDASMWVEQVRISSRGLHWEALDEDISIAGLLAGHGDQTSSGKVFAA